jgi:16S rRNA (cytidine1402-2'-O)-methyltransferase
LTGILYLIATPIGNLEDITLRAIRILQTADLIAAEDTRHTAKLLQRYQITTPVISYHQHSNPARLKEILTALKQGKAIALVTDAGMPAIADPGYELVKASIEAGIEIVPIPGANAALTALVASGLKAERFVFEGFLPTKKKLRSDRLNSFQREPRTLVFYEAPHRLEKTLADLGEILGFQRQIVLGRELTKLYEEFWRGTIGEAIAYYREHQPKGEYTIVVAGSTENSQLELSAAEIKAELRKLLQQGMTKTEASRHLAQYTSWSRREIYQLALENINI